MPLHLGVSKGRCLLCCFYLLSVLLGELSWEVQPGDEGSAPSPAWCCAAPRRALRCPGCRLGCALQSGLVPDSMCVASVGSCWSDRELMLLTPFIPRAAAWAAHTGTLCAEWFLHGCVGGVSRHYLAIHLSGTENFESW